MQKLILIAIFAIGICSGILTTQGSTQQQKLDSQAMAGQQELWYESQLLDHFNPEVPQKLWKQRYFVLDDYFDAATGPLFLYICGESACHGMPSSRTFTKELAEEHKGIVVTLEHRFYGQSQPFGQNKNSYTTENLQYLTQQQGLADLAQFIGYLKSNSMFKISADTPVITVGGSYPGAMSAWFRYKFKHLTIGGYASSGVVNAIEDFEQYDMQIGISASYSGAYCPSDIQALNAYVEKTLQNPFGNIALKTQFKAELLSDLEFLEMFADIFSGLVQYGNASKLCNEYLKDQTIQEQLQNLAKEASDPDSYTIDYQKDTAYDENKNARQWTYQCCTAFGWWQTAYKPNPFRSTEINVDYYNNKCKEIFGEDFTPNVPETNVIMGATGLRVTNLVFTNGGEDPWQWASVTEEEYPMKAYVAECQGCGHCCDLSTPKESDPPELKYVREQVAQNIDLWLEEYRRQTYSPQQYEQLFSQQQQSKANRTIDQDLIEYIENKTEQELASLFRKSQILLDE